MGTNLPEMELETKRLKETIALAEEQLEQAKRNKELIKEEMIKAKQDLRENTTHSIGNLWSSEDFEALVELSQCMNPVLDKIAEGNQEENKIRQLEYLIKSPYFARINFRFEDEEEAEKIYIGRSSLKKNTQDIYVYDWRSPIASVFYRFMPGEAYYDAPGGRISGELSLKRQYEIKNGTLEYYFDADMQIIDEFLRQMLSKNTSPKMKSIVETIQREQDIIIRNMENDLLMVQGVAGSGKTSIALHRTAYLMYQGLQDKLSANDIVILSPNSLFEQYISSVLPELGEDNVTSIVFDDILQSLLKDKRLQTRNQFLEDIFTDPLYQKRKKDSLEFKTSLDFLNILDRFLEDIPGRWIEFEDIHFEGKCYRCKDLLRKKVMQRSEVSLGARLEQLENYILEMVFGNSKGRGVQERKNLLRQDIQRFTKPDIVSLYQKLFTDKDYFYSLIPDTVSTGNMEEIWEFTRNNLASGHLYYDDAAPLAYLYLKIYKNMDYQMIKQVVIDEAQDYYPLQYKIIGLLFSNAKFTVLGDMNQALEKQADLSLYEQIPAILNKKNSLLVTLDKSFRCTNEILNFSLQFIRHAPKLQSFNRTGAPVTAASADTRAELIDRICEEIALCKEKGYQSIGLICKSEEHVTALSKELRSKTDLHLVKEDATGELRGIFAIPVYMSKGLEFDAVIVCDADANTYRDQEEGNLLYIASTRALHRLSLFGEGELSPLIHTTL